MNQPPPARLAKSTVGRELRVRVFIVLALLVVTCVVAYFRGEFSGKPFETAKAGAPTPLPAGSTLTIQLGTSSKSSGYICPIHGPLHVGEPPVRLQSPGGESTRLVCSLCLRDEILRADSRLFEVRNDPVYRSAWGQ